MTRKHDLAVRWNSNAATLRQLDRLGGVPLHGTPKHLRLPGGRVLVVLPDGKVGRVFTARGIEPRASVLLASGHRQKGCIVTAAGGIRRPKQDDPRTVRIRFHAVGQFRYYDAKKNRAVFIAPPGREKPDEPVDPHPEIREPSREPYVRGLPGSPKGDPEARLVDEYVKWTNDAAAFEHRRDKTGERMDLFDRSRWRLIEAKANIDRRTIRTAVGQLLDYRLQFKLRRPSLWLLLPAYPGRSALTFIHSCRCRAIWRSPSGVFYESQLQ